MNGDEKKCYKCLEVKCVSLFSKDRRLIGGLRLNCKACDKIYLIKNIDNKKKYNELNKVHLAEYLKEYAIKNKEKLNAYRRKRYLRIKAEAIKG